LLICQRLEKPNIAHILIDLIARAAELRARIVFSETCEVFLLIDLLLAI